MDDRCPQCRHMPHGETCYNMASDNDCACTYGVTPVVETRDFYAEIEVAQREDDERKLASQGAATHTLVELVQLLNDSYPDEWVARWLGSPNRHLMSKPDRNWPCTPLQYIGSGWLDEVYVVAERIEGS